MREQDDKRQPEQIENEIARTRAEVSSTIDAIQNKLSPGQMVDQAVAYARSSLPADFGVSLGNSVRDNPVPVVLIGVGIAWLMLQGRHADGQAPQRRRPAEYDSDFDGSGYASRPDDGSREPGKIRRVINAVGDKARALKHQAGSTGHSLSDKAGVLGQRVGDSASAMTDRTRQTVSSAGTGALGQRSQQQYYRARDSVGRMLDEQPLLLGALGAAIGTLLGAALPTTRQEDRLMGHTRDSLLDNALDTAREKAYAVKESAQRAMQSAGHDIRSSTVSGGSPGQSLH